MFDAKKELRWSKIKVGLVISAGLLALLLAVLFAGNIQALFAKKVEIKALVRDVSGLKRGAPVWIYGTEVGFVKKIHLHPEHGTVVTIALFQEALPFLKKDSQASILTMGLLGDKYVELNPGSPQAPPLQPGDTIRGSTQMELRDVMETSSKAIDGVTEFIQKVDRLVTKIEAGEGTFSKFLTDPTLYNHLEATTRSLSMTMEAVRKSRGTLSKLIQDPSLYDKALAAVSSMEEMTRKLKEGEGTLKKLVEDPTLYHRLVRVVSGLEEFTRTLTEKEGTVKKLLEDPALYENLKKGSEHLASILSSVDKGQGVAGTLLRDDGTAMELREAIGRLKELTMEMDALALEFKNLLKDMKEHPKRYFKFSIF